MDLEANMKLLQHRTALCAHVGALDKLIDEIFRRRGIGMTSIPLEHYVELVTLSRTQAEERQKLFSEPLFEG